MQLFTESTRVYGDYFVILEECAVDTKQSDESATSIQSCKYNCTIKGLELDAVLEEKLYEHALFWQADPPFVKQEAHPTEHSLRLSAGGWKAEVFPWKLWPSWPPPIQGIIALVQSLLFSVPASKES